MMASRTIRFFDRLQPFFRLLGVDYPMMRTILQVKLAMDARRAPTLMGDSMGRGKKKKQEGNLFLKSLWIYALFGALFTPIILFGNHYLFQTTIYFGVIMFFIMMSMISDFSAVLLELRDKSILFTKPIDRRTINAARTVHIFYYLTLLTGALAAPGAVAGTVLHGPLFLILFVPELILIDIFVLVLTAFIYLVILKFFDGERLKDMINYAQIILSISVAVGYQFLGRLFTVSGADISFDGAWWQYAVPPLWFGAPYEWLLGGHGDPMMISFALLGLAVPILALLLYIKISPALERYMEKLSEQSTAGKRRGAGLDRALAKLFCRSSEERTFFRFAAEMIKSDRPFKLRVYPMIGFALIFPFVFIYTNLQDQTWDELASGRSYLFLYFTFMMIPSAITMLRFCGSYKGGWIYTAAPIRDWASISRGALKACVAKLFLPVYLFLSVAFLVIFQFRIPFDLAAVFLAACLLTVMTHKILNRDTLPFSLPASESQGDSAAQFFLLTIAAAPFALLHFLGSLVPFGTVAYVMILLVANIAVWRRAL